MTRILSTLLQSKGRIACKIQHLLHSCSTGSLHPVSSFGHHCLRLHWQLVVSWCFMAHLRSAERHDMLVPLTRTQFGRHSFHVAAPAVWNALPSHLRLPSISRGQFRAGWKTISSHRPTDTSENFC